MVPSHIVNCGIYPQKSWSLAEPLTGVEISVESNMGY